MALLPTFSASVAAAEEQDYSSLLFDPDTAYVDENTLAPGGILTEQLVYRTYKVESYVTNPIVGKNWGTWAPTASERFFNMFIHVPVSYGENTFDTSLDSKRPIMLKVNWGGDQSSAPNQTLSNSDSISLTALSEGWVVVDPGMLGANCSSEGPNGEPVYNYGKAPYPVASLKAAIRYLRYGSNASTIPGDKEKIFATGTSSGGCGTVMLAASGNSTLFDAALTDLGAAPGRDDIYGTLASCPIVPRDYSDEAIAFLRFFWLDFETVDTSLMTDEQKMNVEINKGLVDSFQDYLPSLNLTTEYAVGSIAAGEPVMVNSMLEYFYPYLKQSCITYLNNLGDRAAIDSYLAGSRGTDEAAMTRSDWIVPVFDDDNETVIDLVGDPETFWKNWIDYVYRVAGFGGPSTISKGLDPSVTDLLFDKPYISPLIENNGVLSQANAGGFMAGPTTAGSSTFGKPEDYAVAYSPFGLAWITNPAHQGVTVSQEYYDLYELQNRSLDPMYFIRNAESLGVTVAPNWFIRTGAADTVAMPAMFLSLATTLENRDFNVNATLVWDEGHGQSSEWPQFFDWSASLVAPEPDPIDYKVLEHFPTYVGADQNAAVSARIDAPLSKFVCLMLGEQVLNETYYSLTEGSTVVTLRASYLNGLENGSYTFTAVFTDGTATLPLTVNESSGGTDPDDGLGDTSNNTPNTSGTTNTDESSLPNTGDASLLALCITLALAIAGSTTLLLRKHLLKRKAFAKR
jgi:hypothetical protein